MDFPLGFRRFVEAAFLFVFLEPQSLLLREPERWDARPSHPVQKTINSVQVHFGAGWQGRVVYNPGMGRLKIKKKGDVLPFRQTMAYRMMCLTVSIIAFVYTVYEMVIALAATNTLAFIISAVIGVGVAFTVFFNLDRLKYAKVSPQTAKRMNRR